MHDMTETRFWMIRHALVEENARAMLYGIMDVALCPDALVAARPIYAALARRLPRPAAWCVHASVAHPAAPPRRSSPPATPPARWTSSPA